MNENLKQYYEYLKSANADVPDSYESFATTLANEEYSQQYFKYLKDNNFDAPDSYESFSETLGLKKKSPLTDIGQGTGLVSEDLSKPAEVSSQGQQPLPLEVKPIDLVEKYTQGIEIAGVKPERESYFGDLIERMGAGAIGVVTSGPKQTRLAQKLLNIPRNVLKKELSILGISEETAERISSSVPFLKGKELEAGINIATGLWDKIEKTGEFKDIEKKKEELKQSSQRYDQTIGELFKSKQYNKAIGASFLAGAESLPLTLSAMFGGPIALAEIGLYSASEQYDHLKPNDDMAEVEKIANALVNGGLEIVTERLGSANYGKLIKGLYKTAGKQQAE
jgi:hypothetical protein